MTDDEIEPKVAIHDTSPKHKDDLIQGTTKAEDEIFPTLAEKDKLLAEWLEIAVAVYNNQVTPKNAENTIICVPQLITTLEFFAQTASETPQRNIKNILYHSTSSSLANKKNLLANFLMDWERNIATYAKPGNFCTQRRLLVNHGFTKSYSLDTFTTFNMLGIEVKILFNEGSDIIRWFKNGCKMKQYPETLGNPINLWPKRNDSTALEKHRETNNCKCPIFVAVSHFEFPFKSCAFDNAKLYQISFRPSPSEKIQVLAFRITCTKLMPLRFNQIAPKCRIIELPSVAEHLSMYIIENCDEIAIQNGNELKQYILSMKNAQVDNEIESLYIPSFFGYPKTTLNIAQSFANALKEVDILFQPGSFNDLAFELAEPSITFKPASSIQHYNHFELMKLPEFTKSNISTVLSEKRYHKLSQPFMFIVWENKSQIPLYISRIAAPDCTNADGDGSAKDKAVSKPKNKWNHFSWFFQLFKKKPKVEKQQVENTVDIPGTITQSQKLDP